MKGRILEYSFQSNIGYISADDGNHYSFNGSEWKSTSPPLRGMTVDFAVEGEVATGVYIALDTNAAGSVPREKSKIAAGLLAFFLGGLGIHKFYLGFSGPGLVFLLINTVGFLFTWILLFIPNIIMGVIAVVEGIIYLTTSDQDFYNRYEVQKRKWF